MAIRGGWIIRENLSMFTNVNNGTAFHSREVIARLTSWNGSLLIIISNSYQQIPVASKL